MPPNPYKRPHLLLLSQNRTHAPKQPSPSTKSYRTTSTVVSASSPALHFDISAGLPDLTDEYWAGPLLNFPQLQPANPGDSPSSSRGTYSSHRILPRVAAPHASAYFSHFHHYMPIVHKGSFSLVSGPELLVSIVVAIGSRYASHLQPQGTSAVDAHNFGNDTWRTGLNALAKMVGGSWFEPQDNVVIKPAAGQKRLCHLPRGVVLPELAAPCRIWILLR